LKIKALMSCGHPGESEETVTDIRDWLIRNQVDDFDCTVITTYPGTPYYDLAMPHADRAGCVDLHASQRPRRGCMPARSNYTCAPTTTKGDPMAGIGRSSTPSRNRA